MRIFSVVVLYYPPSDLEANIRSFLPSVEALMVIDNTQPSVVEKWRAKFSSGDRIFWQANEQNEGVAKPWNLAAKWALKEGADWLLLMDQDSFFKEGELEKMIVRIKTDLQSPGIISPVHRTKNFRQHANLPSASAVHFVMGSGNLVSLEAYERCGPFDEKLFLDLVDHDYCIRLRKQSYLIWQMNDVFIEHQLGKLISKGSFSFVGHSPIRKYYMSRNRIAVAFRHAIFDPRYFLFEIMNAVADCIKIILIEDNKWSKIRYSALGMWHAFTGTYGKLSEGPK